VTNTPTSPITLQIALPTPLPRLFDYLLPADLLRPEIGTRVKVNFAGRSLLGFVAGFGDRAAMDPATQKKLKAIDEIVDAEPLLPPDLWNLLRFAADYYQRSLGDVLHTAVPRGMRKSKATALRGVYQYRLVPNSTDGKALRSDNQRKLVDVLAAGALLESELDQQLSFNWRDTAKRLCANGVLQRELQSPFATPLQRSIAPVLNVEQQFAVEQICASLQENPRGFLLQGVTGSGKTEVYLAAADAALRQGRSVLVLVPEIGLTPQTLQRFRGRLAANFAVMHSALSDGERAYFWQAAHAGEINLLLGTRSAIFAPLRNLGLIIVDEEHDGSYKQIEGFRYHARDLAIKRASDLRIPIVLGSATPSLESLFLLERRRLERLWLRIRAVAKQMPATMLLDTKQQHMDEGLSNYAATHIETALLSGAQVLVLRNRRGYAPRLGCGACGDVIQCQHCDRPMTYYRKQQRLRCHYCDAQSSVPSHCQSCGADALVAGGEGTERIEAALEQRFAEWPVYRIDRNSMARKGSFDALLLKLAAGEPCLIIGTQMLAKGHDLPNIALVVVIGADDGLYSIDFRSPERLAQLLLQVAGRAGRATREGLVLIQTEQPEHPLLKLVASQDYEAISAHLLQERQDAGLPPYARMAILRAESRDQSRLYDWCNQVRRMADQSQRELLMTELDPRDFAIYGPIPASMAKRAGVHRAQLVLSSVNRNRLQQFLKYWIAIIQQSKLPAGVQFIVDVDPQDEQ
jgi:primosomal protein N' (replication factor Y) (superfamily II helicase)